jgi:hypothetical protein
MIRALCQFIFPTPPEPVVGDGVMEVDSLREMPLPLRDIMFLSSFILLTVVPAMAGPREDTLSGISRRAA